MIETTNYQMAIDLLCCHLGLTEEEAKKQLGLSEDTNIHNNVVELQHALMGFTTEK